MKRVVIIMFVMLTTAIVSFGIDLDSVKKDFADAWDIVIEGDEQSTHMDSNSQGIIILGNVEINNFDIVVVASNLRELMTTLSLYYLSQEVALDNATLDKLKTDNTYFVKFGQRAASSVLALFALKHLSKKTTVELFDKYSELKGIRIVGYRPQEETDEYGNPYSVLDSLFSITLMIETAKKVNWEYWESKKDSWLDGTSLIYHNKAIDYWKKILDEQWYNSIWFLKEQENDD